MSEIDFKDKVIIITGAGNGLGRAYALEFAKRGAKIVVNDAGCDRNGFGSSKDSALSVTEEIIKTGGKAVANFDAISTFKSGENIIKTAIEAFGKVDILINNAGIIRDKSILKMTEEDWDIVCNVNLKGSFAVTRAAFAEMKKNNYGKIIFTGSGSGAYGNFGQVNYAAAKSGLFGLMNVVNIEGARSNIKANMILPVAATRISQDIFPPEIAAKLKPEFIVALVVFLCSDENTSAGLILNCAGGWYSRSVISCTEGVLLGRGKSGISTDEIKNNWAKILELRNEKQLSSVAETFNYMGPLFKQ